MNARGVALQGALAALGLLAALFTWQREPEGQPGEVTVLDISKRALQKVRFDDASRMVELFRDKDGELWVRLGDKPKAPPPPAPAAATDGGVTDGGVAGGGQDAGVPPVAPGTGETKAPAEAPPPMVVHELRANQNAENLFGHLAPLKGSRSLGDLDQKKLEELGLVNTPRKLTFTVDGREQTLVLATPQGAPWGTPYALREDGKVFLLSSAILPDFEGGINRLVDRRPHLFDEGDFDSFTVIQGKSSRTYLVTGKPPGEVKVAPKDAPDKPDEFAHNWHDRIWRTVVMDVMGRGEEPEGGAPEEVFRVEYRKGDKPVGFFSVSRGSKGDLFGKTEHSAGWIRFHGGMDTLVNEAAKVASGS